MPKNMIIIILVTQAILFSSIFATKCRDGTECADNQSCCYTFAGVFCCLYEDGICCGDGLHCCPKGYICGYNSCSKSSDSMNNSILEFLTEGEDVIPSELLKPRNRNESDSVTIGEKSSNKGSIQDEEIKQSRIDKFLDKLNYINNSYIKKIISCVVDVEPMIADLLNAYIENKINLGQSFVKNIIEVYGKISKDASKLSTDCKDIFHVTIMSNNSNVNPTSIPK